jgi:hypothetical protein
VDVLRHLYEALAPRGLILDLRSVPPPSLVEVGGKPTGELDESEFFPRSEHNGGALVELAREGMLTFAAEERHEIVIVYPSGRDLVEDVAGWGSTKVPDALADRLVGEDRECRIREYCLTRAFSRSGSLGESIG